MGRKMAMEYLSGNLGTNMKDIGRMMRGTVKEFITKRMETGKKESMKRDKKKRFPLILEEKREKIKIKMSSK